MNRQNIIAARDTMQAMLDNYQVMDTASIAFKSALVQLNSEIDAAPEAPVSISTPVVGTADVIAGVLAGLAGMPVSISGEVLAVVQTSFDTINARLAALTPPPPIAPTVLAPTDAQVAAAQAVMAAIAATQPAVAPAPAAPAPADATAAQ